MQEAEDNEREIYGNSTEKETGERSSFFDD